MTRSVLLLRAVNVSGRNRVPMAQLREVLAPVLGEVSTYIASGNIVCEHPDDPTSVSARVRELIADEFDVDTPVILRTHDDLVHALDARPFGGASEKLLHAMFLEAPAAPGVVEALQERLVPGERIALVGDDLWIDYAEGGVHSTRLTKAVLDRALGVAGTARNLRTIRKLAELTA
ncbi:hypothetical protein RU09_08905 [Microbacterium sp. MEJ108Y]|uniref:DUF1697 domain-containing protein n=1 Tax=Microbacterium sp. MEJ108Y TaxID=1587523 RepID=UPI0005ABC16E|nr:DUF1697 domain-containing protein [Microbacterium sp. MEJ108Y]KIP92192.1 hypothetical protein RU09_08905 [Microbacterium sp. MEJ108Y]